ncbi:hypothetical protein M3Y96_01188900 [Aphelenchoides besseyi]|nr:hypothetical protein M3Y96_01188900 [Aphelenchoides besseyi]
MLAFDLISAFGCLYSSLLCSNAEECFNIRAPSRKWESCHSKSLGLLFVSLIAVIGVTLLIITLVFRRLEEFFTEYDDNVELATSNSNDEIQPKKSPVHNEMSAAGDVLFNWETSSDKKND